MRARYIERAHRRRSPENAAPMTRRADLSCHSQPEDERMLRGAGAGAGCWVLSAELAAWFATDVICVPAACGGGLVRRPLSHGRAEVLGNMDLALSMPCFGQYSPKPLDSRLSL